MSNIFMGNSYANSYLYTIKTMLTPNYRDVLFDVIFDVVFDAKALRAKFDSKSRKVVSLQRSRGALLSSRGCSYKQQQLRRAGYSRANGVIYMFV